MIVWNPVDSFVSKLASSRQRYRCRVDGQDEYRGESLPTGTQAEVLAWIEARFTRSCLAGIPSARWPRTGNVERSRCPWPGDSRP